MPSAAEYRTKAIQCRKWAATALTASERFNRLLSRVAEHRSAALLSVWLFGE